MWVASRWMRQALDLARQGDYRTSPNPMVGAVLVHHGMLVGAGYHRSAGGPHAEVEALGQADNGRHLAGCSRTLRRTPKQDSSPGPTDQSPAAAA